VTIAARQQRVLIKIECMLRGTDPRLAAKFRMFSWLTSGEEMPRIEQLTSPPTRRRGNIRIGQLSFRLWVLLCMAVAAGALAAALLAEGGASMRPLPVKSAQGYSLQSGGAADYATHMAWPTAAYGLRHGSHGAGPGVHGVGRRTDRALGSALSGRRPKKPARNKPMQG
jgi:hypothetical protein